MEAQLKPEYHFDDTAETVAVDVGVHEGDQYRMGQLQFLGITDSASAPLRKLWKLHGGDVYDSSYPTVFFASVGRQFDLSRFRVGASHKLQRESKTVDVFIQLSAQ
jgi:outer membrane protein assembly factor BamA